MFRLIDKCLPFLRLKEKADARYKKQTRLKYMFEDYLALTLLKTIIEDPDKYLPLNISEDDTFILSKNNLFTPEGNLSDFYGPSYLRIASIELIKAQKTKILHQEDPSLGEIPEECQRILNWTVTQKYPEQIEKICEAYQRSQEQESIEMLNSSRYFKYEVEYEAP